MYPETVALMWCVDTTIKETTYHDLSNRVTAIAKGLYSVLVSQTEKGEKKEGVLDKQPIIGTLVSEGSPAIETMLAMWSHNYDAVADIAFDKNCVRYALQYFERQNVYLPQRVKSPQANV